MEYLAGGVSSYELQKYVGQSTIRNLPAGTADMGSIQMVTPDNRTFMLAGTEKGNQIAYDCRPIDVPGIYQLKSGDRTLDIFPANVSLAEGDLTSLSYDQYSKAIGAAKYTAIPYNKPSGTIVTETRFGRELWKIFLWAAAIIMAVEMLFSRETAPAVEKS